MATLCLPDLERALNALSLGGPVPSFAEADVLGNPLDVCRSYLAGLLCDLIDCDPKVAYNSIQWPNNIDAGDLAIILPKLYPGVKPDEAAIDLMAKVRIPSKCTWRGFRADAQHSSQKNIRCFLFQFTKASIYGSSSKPRRSPVCCSHTYSTARAHTVPILRLGCEMLPLQKGLARSWSSNSLPQISRANCRENTFGVPSSGHS